MYCVIARVFLLAGMFCSFPLSAWSANLLLNGSFNKPAQGVPVGTPVSYTGLCAAVGNSAAANWNVQIGSCDTGFNDLQATLVPSTLPLSTGYMQHVVTDGNDNGLYQQFTFSAAKTLTSVWVYVNSGCVGVGTGAQSITGLDDIFCVPGKWFQISKVPNDSSPVVEIVIYSANWIPGQNGADFYVKNASVVIAP
jgi:hypothetical protein